MNINLKKIINTASSVLLSFSSLMPAVHAGALNDQADKFWQTQTGAYLHAMYPLEKPEQAVRSAMNHFVTTHKNHVVDQDLNLKLSDFFDYNNTSQEIEKLYTQLETFLLKEIEARNTHTIFYHGFSSMMAAYNATLKELSELANLKELGHAHPLHYKFKKDNEIKNMADFLDKKRYLNAHLENCSQLKKNAHKNPTPQNKKYLNLKPFCNKNLGVGKAPDSSDYSRLHLKSVNVSLFGNSNEFAENSFGFFITSSNIGKFGGALMTRLLTEVGFITETSTQAEIDSKLSIYNAIFEKKMASSGGGMIQIMMKNDIVDQYAMGAWAKGIPYFFNKKTGKFATRGANNKAIPLLENENKDLYRPSLLNLIDLYKSNPLEFQKKLSSNGKINPLNMDRFQARLFINPKIFSNEKYVKINMTSRNKIKPNDISEFKTELRAQLKKDLVDSMSQNQISQNFKETTALGKIYKYIFEKTPSNIKKLANILTRCSKQVLTEGISLIKEVLAKVQDITQNVVKKIEGLEAIEKAKNTIKATKNWLYKFSKKVLSA